MSPRGERGFPVNASGKESACQCTRLGFNPWVEKIPWRRTWQPTSVFLPGESHGQRSLVGYSPWGHRQSDMTSNLACNAGAVGKFLRPSGDNGVGKKVKVKVAHLFATPWNSPGQDTGVGSHSLL